MSSFGPPSGPPPGWRAPPPIGAPPGWNDQPNTYNLPQAGPDAPYRPYPPAQHAPPPGPPPQHYGYQNQQYTDIQAPPQQNQQGQINFQPQQTGPQPFYFEYSNLSGRKKALFVGINYIGSRNQLRGCHNDVRNVSRFLMDRYGYREEDMVILLDDPSFGYRQQPTRRNIEDAMRWLVSDARPNDALFFHYSGHGGQMEDMTGEEESGFDDTILPVDFEQAGQIIDNEMHDLMVRPLPPGCRLTAIYDSCHSGTALDLPYIYDHTGNIKQPNSWGQAGNGAMTAGMDYLRGDLVGAATSIWGMGKKFMQHANYDSAAAEETRQRNFSPADVISFSGCKDDQTSADASEAGQATGAMSWAFLTVLNKYPQQSYIQLLLNVRAELKQKYSQKPQLSSSHPIDTNLLFVM